jgi:peptidoglycan/LPS O-acetylase OafA/YrhL
MKYRPEIDGLRCIAVLLVFVFHFQVIPLGKAGFMGVDIFFVISGFLISSIIWGQLEAGRFSLRGFYLRRFRRLAPALVCVQLLLIGFSYVLLLPQEVKDLAAQSLTAQAYVINFYLWKHVGYFGLSADSVALLHFWSLAIEEQFYLLYPLLLIGIHRYARRYFVPILATVALGSFLLNVFWVSVKPEAAFYLLPTRAWELLLGALIPFAQPWFEKRARQRQIVALLGVILITAGISLFGPGVAFPGFFALLPTLGTVALFFASAGSGSWVSRLLSLKPLVYIGKISYSMYLVHWPIKVFAGYFVRDYTLGWRWASLVVALGLAMALYHLVENPVRRSAYFDRPRHFLVAYAAGFAVVVLLAVSALASKGWRHRFSADVLRLADATDDRDEQANDCEYQKGEWPGPSGPCRIGKLDVQPTWAVLGDSHAWALSKAFSLFLEQRKEGGVLVFSHGCMPVSGLLGNRCMTFNSDINNWIEHEQGIRNVALVSIWRYPIESSIEIAGGRFVEAGPEAVAVFQDQFARTLRRLHEAKKNTFIWGPLPKAKMFVPSALARNLAFGMHLEVAVDRADHERMLSFMKEAIANNREFVQGSISPASVLCAGGTCAIEDNGAPLFFDDNHPAYSRAPYFAHIIEEQLPMAN